jgi:hypothetical protein
MKPQTQAILFCGLFVLLAHSEPFGAPGPVQPQRSASDLPPDERLVPALPPTNTLPVSADAQGLIEWPSVETLNSQEAGQDRSQTIPPLFRQPEIGDAKPIRLGARSPQAACKEAEQWIRQVLKPQWLPDDLAVRLHPLQRDPASQSIIVCRYTIDGHAIQINQSRAAMWVVIKPPTSNSVTRNTNELGVAAFSNYFLKGDRMASLQGKETDGTAKLRIWLPDYSASIPPGALENWWGWRLWLTDGEAVAVFLAKTSEDSARSVMPDDPWF